MRTEYSGLPSVAIGFWRTYVSALAAVSVMTMFAGAFGALVTYSIAPVAIGYYLVALVGFVVHLTAIYIRDVRSGAYKPLQTTWTTGTLVFAVVVVMGVQVSGLLLVGTVGGALLASVGVSVPIAALVAAYIPVVDVALMRRGWLTPGRILFVGVVVLLEAVFNLHQSITELVPIIGRTRRPGS